ncbi:Phox homologous domain [Phytophthora cinnamomi]|uniref:Phox homologous domain n=1 Tax=Phytophthora cinnamomi TaxID=4785 RepID=UPI00355ABA3A|nr:Phox homologous domain [Phytophthora cinnamomi]
MVAANALDEMDVYTDTASERSSLDTVELGARLSQLSRAKVAVALNSVHHVQMCTAYDREGHVTAYVLDVFLQAAPRGLPVASAASSKSKGANKRRQSRSERVRRELRERDELRADYQVEHRYSAFRTLRERIAEAVAAPKDKSHPQWCPYCTRVRELASSGMFPSRFPSRGRVAIAVGLHDFVVRSRTERLETFVNLLLRAAKDISYRSGCSPCGRFEVVSRLLSDFLMEPHLRTSGSSW